MQKHSILTAAIFLLLSALLPTALMGQAADHSGYDALSNNTTGNNNTAVGSDANVLEGDLSNATAIGANATVDASNKIRLGDANVTLVETAGYVKGLTGLCIGNDCKTAWPAGGVTGVTASAPLASTGGTTPNVSLSGIVPVANGGTGSSVQNFVDLTTAQTVAGAKTFSTICLGTDCKTAWPAGGVTGVTASAPLVSSGGPTPNITLPNVRIDSSVTAIGIDALATNTSGISNTASGYQALYSNTTGHSNTASGTLALKNNTTGGFNVASGKEALYLNDDGMENTASGYYALRGNSSGDKNTASGYQALFNSTVGDRNTASGASALYDNTTGYGNTASGAYALDSNSTGSRNTAVGLDADVSAGDLTNATAIGAGARVDASNKIRLGNDTVTFVETAGDIRVGARPGHTTGCVQDGDGTVIAGTCASDVRFKTRISPFAPLLNRLVPLQPVHFFWKADEYPDRQFGNARSFGLIAQDTEKILPELVTEDGSGYKAVRYNLLPLTTLQAIKEQQEEVRAQREEIDQLKTENADLKARLEALERLVTGGR